MSILRDEPEPFHAEFGTGGEDKDFFMRMSAKGHVFVWCNQAIVHESVPRDRWTRSYMLKRALLRGSNILKLPGQRTRLLVKSVIALPIYTLVLPASALAGQCVFMKYCIRWCDHAGRLMAAVGLHPIKSR
jgi:hypothetical protein